MGETIPKEIMLEIAEQRKRNIDIHKKYCKL